MDRTTLCIDIGNSYIKVAAREGQEWRLLYREQAGRSGPLFSWMDDYKRKNGESVERILVCTVNEEVWHALERRYDSFHLRRLEYQDFPPDLFRYDHPQKLGMDRFFVCFGAREKSSDPVVVIDAGTACTVDCMSADRTFMGGAILPGVNMIRQAMVANLPSLPAADDQLPDTWPGQNSLDCTRWGTTGAFFQALKGFLEKYESTLGTYSLFVTGGDADLVARHLKNHYAIQKQPFLLFDGLQAAYERYVSEEGEGRTLSG